jgi:hypothetical protein
MTSAAAQILIALALPAALIAIGVGIAHESRALAKAEDEE